MRLRQRVNNKYMKIIFLTILISFNLISAGQSLKEIRQLLASRDFTSFEKYIDTAMGRHNKRNNRSNISAFWELKRDLTPASQECALNVTVSIPSKKDLNIGTIYQYYITLLTNNGEIIFYNFSKKEGYGPSYEDFTLQILDSFRNETLLNNLYKNFFTIYGDSLHRDELFYNSNVYGSFCSAGAQKPEMRLESDLIVSNNDSELLTTWLRSTNTEKQVYGIDGLYQLKEKGYKLTTEQIRLINIIKHKKGYLNICNGCVYSNGKITEIVRFILKGKTL